MAKARSSGGRRAQPEGRLDLAEIARLVATAKPDALVPNFLDAVLAASGYDAAVLYDFDRRRARFEIAARRGDLSAIPCVVEGMPLAADALTAEIARSGQPWFADDLDTTVRQKPSIEGGTEGECDLIAGHGYRASAILPLVVEGEPVGLLSLAAREPRRDDPRLRSDLAVAVALLRDSIVGRRLPQANREVMNRVRAIGNSVLAIAAEFVVENVLQSIVDEARAVTGARYAALGIGTDPGRQFHPWVFSGMDRATADRIGRYPRPVGMLGAVLDVERPIRMPDLTQDPRAIGFPPDHPPMHSFLGMPIRYRGASIGHLYLTEKSEASEFTPDDLEAVEVLAAQAAIAYEHARLYERVEEERLRLKAVLESSPLAILYVEKATQFVYANPTAQEFFGVPENEPGRERFLGKIARVDGGDLTLDALPSTRALGGETVLGFDAIVHRSNGSDVPVLISAAPVSDAKGLVFGAVIIFQNLEPLKLERLREEFISVVAHDLRAPIAIISGFAEILERSARSSGAPDGERKAIDNIRTSVRRLNRMVEDLLDVSRIEARRLKIELRAIDLGQLAHDVGERVQTLIGDHPLRVVQPTNPLVVDADATRLEQVLTNLLTNAAKYSSDSAPIDLAVKRADGEAIVSVADRGVGIPQGELDKLFTRFYRTREVGSVQGLGLGLYIAKGIVEAHDGRIWVEERPGGGSVFSFALPLVENKAETERR